MALQAGEVMDKEIGAARARRERRLRHEARLRLTLVRDGARLAGHRGGPVHSPTELASLRSELAALRKEVATLKAALVEVQVPVPMTKEEDVHVPKVIQRFGVQHQTQEQETLQAADTRFESRARAAHVANAQAEAGVGVAAGNCPEVEVELLSPPSAEGQPL